MLKFKKPLAFILTLVLIFSVIPLSAITASAKTVTIGYIAKDEVNIRKEPTTSSEQVANVSKLTVSVLGSKKDALSTINPDTNEVFNWYKISYTLNTKSVTGYIREDLIEVKEYALSDSYYEELSAFPKSYHNDLILLHALYPNWQFVADTVPSTFSESVAAQDTEFRKLLVTPQISYRSMREGCYNWETGKFIATDGGRYGASREVIAYYMDPRNFLNANDIYIFMKQSYDSESQTLSGIKKIVKGTFLEGKITNKKDKYYKKTYAQAILYAAKKSKVNAFVLASTIIQEQGVKGTTFTNGRKYKGKTVYNFFNYKASGTTKADILKNGSKYAYKQKWFTPTESIVGGAKNYASGYIAVGQDTYFYKNYNILDPEKLYHQYAQNVADSLSSATRLRRTYSDLINMKLTFRIPVYKNMPKKAAKLPTESDKYNNYYFEKLKATGLKSFSPYKTSYSLTSNGNLILQYKLPKGATYMGTPTYQLKKGKNTIKLKVKSETGYTRTYTIKISAKKAGVLSVMSTGKTLGKAANGKWYYYVNGKKKASTTLVKYKGTWFYIEDGAWTKRTTMVKYKNKWYYVVKGKWSSSVNTFVTYKGIKLCIKYGKWVNTEEALARFNGKDFYYKYKNKLPQILSFLEERLVRNPAL